MATPPTPAELELAHRLRQLRTQAALTQKQLADAFSAEHQIGSASISAWENPHHPAPIPLARLEPYARLFSSDPGSEPQKLIPKAQLTAEHRKRRDALRAELLDLWQEARQDGSPQSGGGTTRRSWFFNDPGPLVIVTPDLPADAQGALADADDPNYTELQSYADLDSLIELFGHVRAENGTAFPVTFRRASQVVSDDLTGHLVLVGGIAWNNLTGQLLRRLQRLPVRQIEIPELSTGEIFAVDHGAGERRFEPDWIEKPGVDPNGRPTHGVLNRDVALLARLTNPFNSGRTLTICNGVHSRGVLGAVRALTDAQFRDNNEAYLAERFPGGEFAVLMWVEVLGDKTITPDLSNQSTIRYEWPDPEGALDPRRGMPRP